MDVATEVKNSDAILLYLEPALRAEVEAYSAKEGVSVDSFISTASAALIRRKKEEEWYAKPRYSTPEGRAQAIKLLNRAGNAPYARG